MFTEADTEYGHRKTVLHVHLWSSWQGVFLWILRNFWEYLFLQNTSRQLLLHFLSTNEIVFCRLLYMIGDCFQSVFFPCSFTKFMAWWFPMNFAKFLRTPFLQNTFRRLLRHFLSTNEIVFFSWYWQKLIQNMDMGKPSSVSIYEALREMCPNTEFFLVRIFPHSDWIRTHSVLGHIPRNEVYGLLWNFIAYFFLKLLVLCWDYEHVRTYPH